MYSYKGLQFLVSIKPNCIFFYYSKYVTFKNIIMVKYRSGTLTVASLKSDITLTDIISTVYMTHKICSLELNSFVDYYC